MNNILNLEPFVVTDREIELEAMLEAVRAAYGHYFNETTKRNVDYVLDTSVLKKG